MFQLAAEVIDVVASWSAEGDRQVSCCAHTVAGAGFIRRAGSWIKWPAVDRKESDAIVGIERVLRGVAVVDIPINNEHSFDLVFLSRDAGSHGNVVEQTEAHCSFGEGMMSGRRTKKD